MSNSYFQFKQFRIEQGRCAMKITTDACIQGAWTPILPHVKHVLDIGAGTGLLALMLAQRNADINIDAVEYDHNAAIQATENMAASPWHDRLTLIEGDVKSYTSAGRYDLIITNPPFFNNSLRNDSEQKSMARHTADLAYDDLIRAIMVNLSDTGYVSLLLPAAEYILFKKQAENAGLYEYKKLLVQHTSEAQVKRVVGLFNQSAGNKVIEEALIIKDNSGEYTPEFTRLLAPFYLGL